MWKTSRRTLSLSSKFANKMGIVIDTMSFVNTGYDQTSEKIGFIKMSANGVGRYYPPRESKYLILFKGFMDMIYDEVGNPDNWIQKIEYAIPYTPILKTINLSDDLFHYAGYDQLHLYWHTPSTFGAVPKIRTFYEIWVKIGIGAAYVKFDDDIEAEAYVVKIDQLATWNFKVRGLNIKGVAGSYSNEVTLIISDFAPVTDGEHTYEVK